MHKKGFENGSVNFVTCAGLTLNDGPLVAEQRTFAHKYLKGFVLRSNSLEENINLELNQVLEDMGRKCGRPVAINGMFSIPVLNAFWNIFMGQRFEHDDPQLRRISQAVAKYGKVLPFESYHEKLSSTRENNLKVFFS